MSKQINPVLVLGDLIAIVLFAVIGISSHERDYSIASLARTILPFLLPWLVIAGLTGLFQRSTNTEPVSVIKPVLLAWLPSWLIGHGLRMLIWGRAFSPAFAIVSLLVAGALLLGWRAAYTSLQEPDV